MQGGVGDCTNEIAQALAKRGVQVSVLTTDAGMMSVVRRPSSVQVFRTVKKWDWSALSVIRETLSATQTDIFHIQYQTGAFGMHPMINFAPRLLSPSFILSRVRIRFGYETTNAVEGGGGGVRSVATFHDLLPAYLFPKAGPVRDWVTFQLARGSDAVIATNQEDAALLEGVLHKSVSIIPIGSNIDPTPPPDFDRPALRAQLGVAPDEILLCYFGFLNESKGGETLIRALAELPNAKLLMLGGQTGGSDVTNIEYLARVKKTIAELGLDKRVIWTDFMPPAQVSAHFLASDICVLPYRDGASYRRGTLMAALAHGVAIVTTPPRRVAEEDGGRGLPALRAGENVLLVPPNDSQAIVEAVKNLAGSVELRAKLQHGARATAEFFTWDKIADAHLELYQRLLDAP